MPLSQRPAGSSPPRPPAGALQQTHRPLDGPVDVDGPQRHLALLAEGEDLPGQVDRLLADPLQVRLDRVVRRQSPRAKSLMLERTLNRLLKSWAMPPDSRPTSSNRWARY